MDDARIDAYLKRIGLSEAPDVSLDGLETLQRAHLTAVPFENLDVFAHRGVGTDLEWSIPKIVDRQRGGWCFEVNGAFGALLTALGFTVTRRAATVLLDPPSGEPSHLANEVQLDGPYLVDVGFGDSYITPLRLDTDIVQQSGGRRFRLAAIDGFRTLVEIEGREEKPLYRLEPEPWALDEFTSASERLQNQPGLHWTTYRFATRLIDGGPDRVTLLEDRIKFRRDGEWIETPVSEDEWDVQLAEWFAMTP